MGKRGYVTFPDEDAPAVEAKSDMVVERSVQ
jgi:hypothetical protein